MSYLPVLIFAAVYALATLLWRVPGWVGIGYAIASAACFAAYAIDKAAARARERRTPERTLLLLGLCGGWPGAVLAQQWLRHKSSKASFRLRFWMTVLANGAVFVVAAGKFGGAI
jgi:uncharacterized membrane protein YsdA (DUF1294 family)